MRTPSISTVQYQPGPVPTDLNDLPRYLQTEFEKIAATVSLLSAGHIDVSYAPPVKPRQGNIRYADGVLWNPGGSEGLYLYNSSGVWIQLG